MRVTLPVFRTLGDRAVVVRYGGSPLLTRAMSKVVVHVRR